MSELKSYAAALFGQRVHAQREALKLSQESAATLAGMHVSNFGKIERGQANPSLHTIVIIASVLEIDPALLVKDLNANMLPYRKRLLTAKEFLAAQRE